MSQRFEHINLDRTVSFIRTDENNEKKTFIFANTCDLTAESVDMRKYQTILYSTITSVKLKFTLAGKLVTEAG